ncbi:MAG: TetR/AcrR family transcriptional regulator [Treponema sp.]|jgi:AcrR family transcriptional regulator|nr:TetR/AcrR family transcriptional regulator [Treponema sp.]
MAQKRELTGDRVLSAAVAIAEKKGMSRLSIRELAASLNVKPASLYNHISGIDEAKRYITKFSLHELEAAVRDAAIGRSREEALKNIAFAYRRFAKTRPELYKAFIASAASTARAAAEIEEAKQNVMRVFHQALETCHLPPEAATHFIRHFRSSLHGFVSLEEAGFFQSGVNIDESFTAMVESFVFLLTTRKGKAGHG